MVIGNGMLAIKFMSFKTVKDVVIFASGVSNSASQHHESYARESALLEETIRANPHAVLVYFSTCSIYQPSLLQNKYVQHKLEMEALVQANAKQYLLLRLSNPVGITNNKHTVFNYFIEQLINMQPIAVWQNAKRNLMDIDDVYNVSAHIINNQLFKNDIVNIAHPKNFSVHEILQALETYFKMAGNYTYLHKGDEPNIDLQKVMPVYNALNVPFPKDYLHFLLKKYFSDGV